MDAEGVYYNFSQSGALTNNSDSSTGFIRDSQNQVRVPYSPDLNTTNFTVEAWACLTSNPLGDDAWYAVLASCGAGASGQKGYAFYASSDATWQSWFYLDSVTKWGVCTGPEFVIGQWAYLAMVIINPIPGQESRNSDYLLESGVAIKANNLSTLGYKIERLLKSPDRLELMKAEALKISHPRAAFEILRQSLELIR